MATGVIKNNSVIGLAEEVTEGTWVTPAAWVQPLDGFEVTSTKEELERAILTSALTMPTPRTGIKGSTLTLPLEFKASGTEGAVPESDLLLKNLLGASRQISTQITTKATVHTTTVLEIEDADIASLLVGDFIVLLESGAHSMHFITARDDTGGAANVTISPAAPGVPSSAVVISKSTTYYPVSTGHSSLSGSVYWGDTILEKVMGLKVASMSLDNFSVGQLPGMSFSLQGLDFDRIDGSSSGASYLSGLPPVLLASCLYQDGVSIPVSEVGLSVENEIAQTKELCDAQGITSQRYIRRNISGNINPYMDDTSVAQFANFDNETEYGLILTAATPSAVAGELDLGSCCGIYLPQVLTINSPVTDVDGILADGIEFKATGGADGTSTDIYMGFV